MPLSSVEGLLDKCFITELHIMEQKTYQATTKTHQPLWTRKSEDEQIEAS